VSTPRPADQGSSPNADAGLDAPLRTLDGRATTLREHLADPLVVFVWASW